MLSTVLPQSSEAVDRALQQNMVGIMHRLLKVCTHRQTDCILLNSVFLTPFNCQILTRLNRFPVFAIAVQSNRVVIPHLSVQRNDPGITKYAMQTLAVCTAASRRAREELLRSDESKE